MKVMRVKRTVITTTTKTVHASGDVTTETVETVTTSSDEEPVNLEVEEVQKMVDDLFDSNMSYAKKVWESFEKVFRSKR